jgi:hypothetical protein
MLIAYMSDVPARLPMRDAAPPAADSPPLASPPAMETASEFIIKANRLMPAPCTLTAPVCLSMVVLTQIRSPELLTPL